MLAKFNIQKIPIKLLISGFSDIRHIDLLNRTCEYFFRSPDSQIKTNNRLNLLHWGLTWNHDFVYAIHTPLAIRNHGKFTPTGLIGKFSFDGKLINYVPTKEKFVQPHQLQYYNGFLWLADTGSNNIKKIDPDTGESWAIIPEPSFPKGDIHHFNGIWIHNNKLYVTSHSQRGFQGRLTTPGVYVLDYITHQFIAQWSQGSHIHNVFILNDQICVCNSDMGTIVAQDGSTQLYVGAYNRGVAITDEYIFVGQSPVEVRERRGGGHQCSIIIFDKNKRQRIGDIQLFNMGQVMEIRCINQKDYAHNQIVNN